ncbi:hypothetical protein H4V97_000631 [Flavobacterium sp. CG_23.5]|uniref:hypothetical protein n=1 Tax=unclassified Flavobacterium TaxID=196869 RepID=UPI0018CB8C24|nr:MULTISPECIES: hypothetical protein [unclassified Flavobacterium]MBG6111594.1 hypothetical protein [Flavobacterium sp. CG_9.10]MBP2282313.1 hypothetical protein [Flavobacterium sp. CG_23.5]
MKKTNETDTLNETISLLEYRQAYELRILKEQFELTYDSLKPLNLIKSAFSEMTTSSELKGNLINNVIGISTGYLTKKLLVGSTHNPFKRILGTAIQFAITNLVTKNKEHSKLREIEE